jgi:hydroxyacyl-ACP dehydratase HTD2-like protein with hotdog domain
MCFNNLCAIFMPSMKRFENFHLVAITLRTSALVASQAVLLINRLCMEADKTDKSAPIQHWLHLTFPNQYNDLHAFNYLARDLQRAG